MLRALAKGAVLTGFGRFPGGQKTYQTLTRDWMGSQATHVDKLARVWPGYADEWSRLAGTTLEGWRVWVHEGGWTPFPFLANYLLTGDAGVVTNVSGRLLDRYLARAVNGVLACGLSASCALDGRLPDVERLRWFDSVRDAVAAIDGEYHENVAIDAIPLGSQSVDLCHSGGVLEHYKPTDLATFLAEARRVLRPGGVMSHVFDHRDHLHHVDAAWPFLRHLGMSTPAYRVLLGHRLTYHNRLLPGEVMEMFATAGFERVAVRRMTLPDHRYVEADDDVMAGDAGIERAALAPRFKAATDVDLRTAAAHYLYRRPLD